MSTATTYRPSLKALAAALDASVAEKEAKERKLVELEQRKRALVEQEAGSNPSGLAKLFQTGGDVARVDKTITISSAPTDGASSGW